MNASEMETGKKYLLLSGEVVEFSRIGSTGFVIVHAPGEPDMQSCWGIEPDETVVEFTDE